MRREYHRAWSGLLHRDMETLVFGHAGRPLIVFPTSMGAFFEYEDRGMIAALAPKLENGELQLFCITTIDTDTFYAKGIPPRLRLDRYLAFERYLLEDVVRVVRAWNRDETIGVTGCSFGAYHAFTMALRHPDIFTSCITMGGAFSLARFLDGHHDLDSYLLSPPEFLPSLEDPWYLDRFRRNKWVFVTGEADICRADTEAAAAMLAAKQIPHSLHVWGHGSVHDWPEWRRMAAAYLP